MTSAPSFNSARLNDVNVRVLSSKNMFTQATPASNASRGGAFELRRAFED